MVTPLDIDLVLVIAIFNFTKQNVFIGVWLQLVHTSVLVACLDGSLFGSVTVKPGVNNQSINIIQVK
jgi:hypothetical protein